jgi:sodium pump decarboxylase gamma subunit
MFGINDFSQSIVDFGNFEFSQLGEAALFGGAILLIGMATIFSVLSLLWLCLIAFKFFFHDLPERRAASVHTEAAPAPVVAAPVAPVQNSNDEIVAVIAAAIAMAESENEGARFRVVSFKKV